MVLTACAAWVTALPGGTLRVSQTLPPMIEPAPMVMRPRMLAPAWITTLSSITGWRSVRRGGAAPGVI